MKVAIFTGTINVQRTSTDVRKLYILERLKYLTHDDIQLEIVTPQVSEISLPQLDNIKYNPYKLTGRRHLKLIYMMIYSSAKLIKLDCELIHCFTYQAAMLAWIINCFRKKKYFIIFEPMGLAYEESKLDKKCSIKIKLLRPFIKFEEKFVFHRSNAIAVYTNLLKDYVSKEFFVDVGKIYVIPHGIDISAPETIDEEKKISIHKKLNIPQENKIVLYSGSLSGLHGTPFLMEVINYINKKRQDISFLILGRGDLEDKLKSFIKENKLKNVQLLGFVPSEETKLYMSLADILLIPHAKCMQTELDQPTKLFEYLASGKPIVSFNLKAIAEVVGNSAVLAEPDNPRALADSIIMLVDNEILCKELGEKGKAISKEYSWETSAKKQYRLYIYLYNNI